MDKKHLIGQAKANIVDALDKLNEIETESMDEEKFKEFIKRLKTEIALIGGYVDLKKLNLKIDKLVKEFAQE